jgi:hypothetical protein
VTLRKQTFLAVVIASLGGPAHASDLVVTGAVLSPFDEVVLGSSRMSTFGTALVFYLNPSETKLEKSALRCVFMQDGTELETRNITVRTLAPKTQGFAVLTRAPQRAEKVICEAGVQGDRPH